VTIVGGNSLVKSAGSTGCNAGAVSSRAIVGNGGYVEFGTSHPIDTTATGNGNRSKAAGLTHEDPGAGIADLRFGIVIEENGEFHYIADGVEGGGSQHQWRSLPHCHRCASRSAGHEDILAGIRLRNNAQAVAFVCDSTRPTRFFWLRESMPSISRSAPSLKSSSVVPTIATSRGASGGYSIATDGAMP
jgi:hypothetical protein